MTKKKSTIERVFGINVPETQTVLALPSSNRDQMGKFLETCDWLQRLENEGWIWQGQIARNWYSDGRQDTEYLDVFRRETRHD